jgi:holo-[acyl-carrier protein] synthase
MPNRSSAATAAIAKRLELLARRLLMPARVGVDAVHIPTWERHLGLGGDALLRRTYTSAELAFCSGRTDRLSSRLAGKEAVLKALGTGIRGVGLADVEIVSEAGGRPTVILHGPARARAATLGLDRIEVSLCHESDFALAVAAGLTEAKR